MFVQDYRNDKGVRRINRLDKDGAMRFSGELDWIYTRVLEKARKAPVRSPWGFDVDALNAMKFRDHVEFDLLHEFVDGYFFDFHVDTKPNDGTMRTVNVNVMLSARDAYEGHSFWDCETWMFPNLVALFPKQALALAEYRSARLEAAVNA